MLVGIDYGSKLAGTTVLAYTEGEEIKILQSQKKQDADQFILNFLKISSPELVGIDAPLSLPGAFRALNNEFFYREADKELNAMSPMFLGGLTARAMKLSASIPIRMVEVYLGALARSKGWKDYFTYHFFNGGTPVETSLNYQPRSCCISREQGLQKRIRFASQRPMTSPRRGAL